MTRHRRVASMAPYLRPRVEEIFDKLQEHFAQPKPTQALTAGYDAEDFRAVFGG